MEKNLNLNLQIEALFRTLPKEELETAIFVDEDNTFFAFGNLSFSEMKEAIYALDSFNTGEGSTLLVEEDQIFHLSARVKEIYVDEDNEQETVFETCNSEDKGAFDITVWCK